MSPIANFLTSSRNARLRKTALLNQTTTMKLSLLVLLVLAPLAAHAQGSPFDNGFTALQQLFTGTIAKVASLIHVPGAKEDFRRLSQAYLRSALRGL